MSDEVLRDEFEAAVDGLRDALEVAEGVIRGMRLGVGGCVELPSDGDKAGVSRYLCYDGMPRDKKRCLHIKISRTRDDFQCFAPDHVSIKTRCNAAVAMPSLVEVLLAQRNNDAASIQKSADELDVYLAKLTAGEV